MVPRVVPLSQNLKINWSFYVVDLQRTAKKFTKSYNVRAQLLFCSLNLFFGDVAVACLIREFKQIATAGATTAAVTEKVWGEYVAPVCQILAK